MRWRRFGDPLATPPTRVMPDRFWAKVDKAGPDGCWIWTAKRSWNGYGQFFYRGSHTYAHRFAYELEIGPIPEGLELDHLCRERACVNPAHLEPVTPSENKRRGLGGYMGAVRQRAKTHCPQGHPYDEENTRIVPGKRGTGERQCRTCRREQRANRRRRTVSAAVALVIALTASACLAPPPAPQVTSKVSCAGTPVEGAIRTAFAGTNDEEWALRTAARESGCNPCAYYPSRSDCTSGGINPRSAKGLFQLVNHDDLILAACPALYVAWNNPVCGAWAARYLYEGSGRRPWGG